MAVIEYILDFESVQVITKVVVKQRRFSTNITLKSSEKKMDGQQTNIQRMNLFQWFFLEFEMTEHTFKRG